MYDRVRLNAKIKKIFVNGKRLKIVRSLNAFWRWHCSQEKCSFNQVRLVRKMNLEIITTNVLKLSELIVYSVSSSYFIRMIIVLVCNNLNLEKVPNQRVLKGKPLFFYQLFMKLNAKAIWIIEMLPIEWCL